MPINRFPDSPEKRELRRRDRRLIRSFCEEQKLTAGAAYCGMPSVEFLDVRAWQDSLCSVCAVENDEDVLHDMELQWDLLELKLPVQFESADILHYLQASHQTYDLYNCDFYGGFIYKAKTKGEAATSKCTEAIRALIDRHRKVQRSFLLIATFNVRDTGASEYTQFLSEIPNVLGASKNVSRCVTEHQKNRARELKLCFPFFCWYLANAANFDLEVKEVFVYRTSAVMVHFVLDFRYTSRILPSLTTIERLKEIATKPLMTLDGQVPVVEFQPTSI